MSDLFIPNELETHLLAIHKVSAKQIAYYRRFCREQGKDYNEFLETNHNFMHAMRRGEGNGEEG
jgi:hypothetical protein